MLKHKTPAGRLPRLLAAAMLLWGAAAAAWACEIPVFQYALEYWESDPYEVTVFHRGPLSAEETEAVEVLRAGADHKRLCANMRLTEVDLAGRPDALAAHLWRQQKGAALPWMVAQYPPVRRIPQSAWAGPLTVSNARSLVDSPKRREIARRLLDGEVAVWALLESGDRRKDAAAAQMLEAELRRLEGTLRLPHLEGWGPPADRQDAPDDIRFSVVRLARDDPEEQALARMLLLSEPDLAEKLSDEPIAFPIYGRGLILYALAGAGINEWTIAEAAEFVTGPCSCQVKASNPGTDLLIALDWETHVKRTARLDTPPLTGMADFGDRAAEAQRRLAALDDTASDEAAGAGVAGTGAGPPDAGRGAGAWGAVAALALAALAAAVVLAARRRRSAMHLQAAGGGEAAQA